MYIYQDFQLQIMYKVKHGGFRPFKSNFHPPKVYLMDEMSVAQKKIAVITVLLFSFAVRPWEIIFFSSIMTLISIFQPGMKGLVKHKIEIDVISNFEALFGGKWSWIIMWTWEVQYWSLQTVPAESGLSL